MTKRRRKNDNWYRVTRDSILMQQNHKCKYCLTKLNRGEATIDHIKPLSKDNRDDPSNYVVACEACNKLKGSDSVNVFMKKIKNPISSSNIKYHLQWFERKLNLRLERMEKKLYNYTRGYPY